jgi:hypothetical protein
MGFCLMVNRLMSVMELLQPRGFGLNLSEQQGSSRAYTCLCSWTRMVPDKSSETEDILLIRYQNRCCLPDANA